MYYFGTHPFNIGHFIWDIETFFDRDNKMSFSLTEMLDFYKYKYEKKGTVWYFKRTTRLSDTPYTMISIAGSPYDTRYGSVSVFFKRGHHTCDEMIAEIKSNKQAMTVIDNMPFEVLFNDIKEE